MLVIKTEVKPSPLGGLGLFAAEFIPKGTVVWEYNPLLDLSFLPSTVESFPSMQKDFIKTYAYLSTKSGNYILSTDNDRFANHSSKFFNVIEDSQDQNSLEVRTISTRDIKPGEEILENYREIDLGDRESDAAFLNS